MKSKGEKKMKNIERMKDEIATLKDMIIYSLNNPNLNLSEDEIKREEHLMKRLAKLQRKFNQM